MRFDLRQNLGHAVDVGLAADEAGFRKGERFRDQMFAAAEADFESDTIDRRIEQSSKIGRAGAGDVERKARQQVFDQVGLVETKLVALAPSEKRAAGMIRSAIVGRCIAIGGIAGCDTHSSVGYSRRSSRALG